MQCNGLTRTGKRCSMQAVKDDLCFHHSQLAHPVWIADIFLLSQEEIELRIRRLTPKELQALELVCDGQTYKRAAAALGMTPGSFGNRISLALAHAGTKTMQQLIALYAIWRREQRAQRVSIFAKDEAQS